MPALTIAIPTKDRAHLLPRAVASALAQTSPEVDVIISDNGSRDTTGDYLAGLRDPRVLVLRQVPPVSMAGNFNACLSAAKGEYFLLLSDDDWLEPEFAEHILALLGRHPDAPLAYVRAYLHSNGHSDVTTAGPEREAGVDFLRAFLAGERDLPFCGTVVRTDALRGVGGYPAGRMFPDFAVAVRLALRGPVLCLPELLTHYSWGPASISFVLDPAGLLEEERAAMEVACVGLAEAGASAREIARVRSAGLRRFARGVASRLFMNACAGVPKARIWRSFVRTQSVLRFAPAHALPRVLAALLAPRAACVAISRFAARGERIGL